MALTKDNTDDRGSWLVVYTVFVLLLDAFATGLLYAIGVFVNSNAGLVFLLFFVYDMSVLALAFLITPFFDRARVRRRDTPFNVSFFKLKMFVCVCVCGDFGNDVQMLHQQTNPTYQNSEITDRVVARTHLVWVTAITEQKGHVVTTPLFISLTPQRSPSPGHNSCAKHQILNDE